MNISSWLLRAVGCVLVGGTSFWMLLLFHNIGDAKNFASLARQIIMSFEEFNGIIHPWFWIPLFFVAGEVLCSLGEIITIAFVKAYLKEDKNNLLDSPFEKATTGVTISHKDFGNFVCQKSNGSLNEHSFDFSEMHFAFGYFWGGIGFLFIVFSFFWIVKCPCLAVLSISSAFCLCIVIICLFISFAGYVCSCVLARNLKYKKFIKCMLSRIKGNIFENVIFIVMLLWSAMFLLCLVPEYKLEHLWCYILLGMAIILIMVYAFRKSVSYRKFCNLIIYLGSINAGQQSEGKN